ncbi:MAG: hypothetical protein P4L55_19435 [Syntrophobacteraceae bacterium]|nr:hypothetical protein [Syntrophobacteraceae bacterium]
MSVVSDLLQKWRERRLARAAKFMDDLKARYHTFRILLANNEYSLDLMRSVEQSLKSGSSDLPEVTEELLSVTYELVDGLNQLSGDRHGRLYETHHNLSDAIMEELDSLMTAESRTPACVFLDDLASDLRGEVGRQSRQPGLVA